MSLDVELKDDKETVEICRCRSCDHEHETKFYETFYSGNITHNLVPMAKEAGLYEPLWYPEEVWAQKAGNLIGHLKDGLARLLANPEKYKKLNPENRWGSYEGLVKFVESYLKACEEHPHAIIHICR